MPLEEVPDAVFAQRMLGDGLAIDPTSGILHAPCAGELISVAPTGHAVTLRTDIGAELLMHVGIDTVALKGEGFEAQVEAGRRVEAGAPLIRFDLDVVARRAPSLVTPVLVTNGERFEIVRRLLGRSVAQGELLMELRAIDGATRATTAPDATTAGLRLRVPLPHGIHARPAALIARRLRDFDARVAVTAHGRRASAASAVSLMSLGVRHGDEIGLEAAGADAQAALAAVAALLEGDHRGAESRAGDRRGRARHRGGRLATGCGGRAAGHRRIAWRRDRDRGLHRAHRAQRRRKGCGCVARVCRACPRARCGAGAAPRPGGRRAGPAERDRHGAPGVSRRSRSGRCGRGIHRAWRERGPRLAERRAREHRGAA